MKVITLVTLAVLLSSCSSSVDSDTTGSASPIGDGCPSGYPIKGNATSKTGELIYHVPSGNYYDRTDPEECFSNETAAEDAGYRKSKR
ncbi:sunset domain-containing protein [Paenibacillus harenae]|uniref:sunset domain-containing protein n=1 Tax=Paenibacillus harenae TaxID=306543 RepID=UPI00278E9236|nr:hypothetical protein [Paenibacillus harenae]MDQ0062326.1 hypothetical protein [Paenibacillus harenae]